MVSFTGTAGAAAPVFSAASSTRVMTSSLTKGRAASWMATSSPFAARTPARALRARVAPPFTSATGFWQRAAAARAAVSSAPVTSTRSVTRGWRSKAATLADSTVPPPSGAESLSNPIRRDEPAATSTAVTVFSIA